MCQKCGNKKCGGCDVGSSTKQMATLQAQIAEVQDQLDSMSTSLKAFLNGHPILLLQNPDDVADFDTSSGEGANDWAGWGICNGQQYKNTITNKFIKTPDLRDKVPAGAGGTYDVDNEFGNDYINLTIAQLAKHDHPVTDPGHTHVITDPGHHHAVTDPGHSHGASGLPHTHTFTTAPNGDHNHGYAAPSVTIGYTSGSSSANTSNLSANDNTTVNGSHTHTGTTDAAAVGVTVQNGFTGLHVDDAYTGITNVVNVTGITVDERGNGDNVDVRQRSYAVFFVMKIQ